MIRLSTALTFTLWLLIASILISTYRFTIEYRNYEKLIVILANLNGLIVLVITTYFDYISIIFSKINSSTVNIVSILILLIISSLLNAYTRIIHEKRSCYDDILRSKLINSSQLYEGIMIIPARIGLGFIIYNIIIYLFKSRFIINDYSIEMQLINSSKLFLRQWILLSILLVLAINQIIDIKQVFFLGCHIVISYIESCHQVIDLSENLSNFIFMSFKLFHLICCLSNWRDEYIYILIVYSCLLITQSIGLMNYIKESKSKIIDKWLTSTNESFENAILGFKYFEMVVSLTIFVCCSMSLSLIANTFFNINKTILSYLQLSIAIPIIFQRCQDYRLIQSYQKRMVMILFYYILLPSMYYGACRGCDKVSSLALYNRKTMLRYLVIIVKSFAVLAGMSLTISSLTVPSLSRLTNYWFRLTFPFNMAYYPMTLLSSDLLRQIHLISGICYYIFGSLHGIIWVYMIFLYRINRNFAMLLSIITGILLLIIGGCMINITKKYGPKHDLLGLINLLVFVVHHPKENYINSTLLLVLLSYFMSIIVRPTQLTTTLINTTKPIINIETRENYNDNASQLYTLNVRLSNNNNQFTESLDICDLISIKTKGLIYVNHFFSVAGFHADPKNGNIMITLLIQIDRRLHINAMSRSIVRNIRNNIEVSGFIKSNIYRSYLDPSIIAYGYQSGAAAFCSLLKKRCELRYLYNQSNQNNDQTTDNVDFAVIWLQWVEFDDINQSLAYIRNLQQLIIDQSTPKEITDTSLHPLFMFVITSVPPEHRPFINNIETIQGQTVNSFEPFEWWNMNVIDMTRNTTEQHLYYMIERMKKHKIKRMTLLLPIIRCTHDEIKYDLIYGDLNEDLLKGHIRAYNNIRSRHIVFAGDTHSEPLKRLKNAASKCNPNLSITLTVDAADDFTF